MKIFMRLVAISVLLVGGFALGFSWKDVAAKKAPSGDAFKTLFGIGTRASTPTEIFAKNYSTIFSESRMSPDRDELKYAAMAGLFSSLGDPYTTFMEPVESKAFTMETTGDFVGIGARLGDDALGAKIAVVFEGSPAESAGLKVGDIIMAVDGKPVAGKRVEEIVDLIRGEEGTSVVIRLVREGVEKPLEVRARRQRIVLPSSEGRRLEGTEIGYVSVSTFAENTQAQFDKSLATALKDNPKGLILDLRSNPGGYLDTAQTMLSRFLENKVMLRTRDSHNTKESILRTLKGESYKINIPIVILINSDSASASEIFAGVMQEYKLATLVGEHTYGKASVQNVIPLRDSSTAKVTIARYYLPSGRNISRKVDEEGKYISGGLKPDVTVKLEVNENTEIGVPDKDSQLKAAVKVIQDLAAKGRKN